MLCGKPVSLPQPYVDRIVSCGQCIACRINRRRQLTARILMEGLCYSTPGTFFTLTYADPHLPISVCHGDAVPVLHPRDMTLFMKRLRKRYGSGIRFFAVGEYGSKTHRPHYHGILFGVPPSEALETGIREVWGKGLIEISEINQSRASYCAQYTVKKWTADTRPELAGRPPEFSRRSMRPGIGAPYVPQLAAMYETRTGALVLAEDGNINPTIRIDGKTWPIDYFMACKVREYLGLPRLAIDRPAPPEYYRDYEQAAKKCKKLEVAYPTHGHL